MKIACSDCLSLVSVKSRFIIFEYLKQKPDGVTVSELVTLTKLRQPTVSFHIQQLVDKGFVKTKKTGRQVWCKIHQKCTKCPLFI